MHGFRLFDPISCRPSRPGESHPEALTDPCLSLSAHTARAIHGELAPSVTPTRKKWNEGYCKDKEMFHRGTYAQSVAATLSNV